MGVPKSRGSLLKVGAVNSQQPAMRYPYQSGPAPAPRYQRWGALPEAGFNTVCFRPQHPLQPPPLSQTQLGCGASPESSRRHAVPLGLQSPSLPDVPPSPCSLSSCCLLVTHVCTGSHLPAYVCPEIHLPGCSPTDNSCGGEIIPPPSRGLCILCGERQRGKPTRKGFEQTPQLASFHPAPGAQEVYSDMAAFSPHC